MPTKYRQILEQFIPSYQKVTRSNDAGLSFFLQLVEEQIANPFVFKPYHQKIRAPIDYYQFGLDFIRPLIDERHSEIIGLDVLAGVALQIAKKENAIFLANHQTESDPQVLSLLLEKHFPQIGENIIYIAGERVTTDPLAIPFSMGCDLLCIYSKRYIDYPPELKAQKQLHNKSTMEIMSRLLQEGGKLIYVAPSGGRDRANAQGVVEVAPFDPQNIEMMNLMAKKAKTATHFYPLTLSTYNLLPPPKNIQKELGEVRLAARCAVKIAFAPEFDMENFSHLQHDDKNIRRQARADAIWNIVNQNYERIRG